MTLYTFEIATIRKQVETASVEKVAKVIGVSRTSLLQAMAGLDVHSGTAIQIRAALTEPAR